MVWLKFTFTQLTPEEINKLKSKLQMLPSMPMEDFEKELEQIDTNYPFSVPVGLQLSVCTNNCGIGLTVNYSNRNLALL